MKSRVMNLMLIAGLLGLAFVLAGCDAKEGNEWERVVCEVELVNAGISVDEYQAGRTPNPDVLCNREISLISCGGYLHILR